LAQGSGEEWWKLDSILSYQDPDDPFIWIDDEILWRLGDSEDGYGERLGEHRARRLLLAPWSGQGLTMAQVDEVSQFIKSVRA
jgi:hypothetical protein